MTWINLKLFQGIRTGVTDTDTPPPLAPAGSRPPRAGAAPLDLGRGSRINQNSKQAGAIARAHHRSMLL